MPKHEIVLFCPYKNIINMGNQKVPVVHTRLIVFRQIYPYKWDRDGLEIPQTFAIRYLPVNKSTQNE
jgi:hypothetical protein